MVNATISQRLAVKKALDAFFCSPARIDRFIKDLSIEVRDMNGRRVEHGWRVVIEVKGRFASVDITSSLLVMQVGFWDTKLVLEWKHL
jgi:hypothetical protein